MAVCGRGHSDFWLGAPERVSAASCVISVRPKTLSYEDKEGRLKFEEKDVVEVVQQLDERMCDAVFVY